MTSILDTLDELTKERHDHIVPRNDDGTLGKAHKVTVKPLLVQIREATYPSSNSDGGSAAQPSTRAVIDFDALTIYAEITAWIRAWCVDVGLETINDPPVDLRRWYMYWDSHNPDDNDIQARQKRMREWVRKIKDHLDPPVTFEADGSCPICGAEQWGNAIDGGSIRPIRIQYRRTEDGAMQDERALCRACETVWSGSESVRELADELAEKRQS